MDLLKLGRGALSKDTCKNFMHVHACRRKVEKGERGVKYVDSKMVISFGDENLAVGCSVVDQGAIASWLEMTRRAWLTTCRLSKGDLVRNTYMYSCIEIHVVNCSQHYTLSSYTPRCF